MENAKKGTAIKTYGFIIACIFLSKLLGLGREVCLAAFYGTTDMAAAFTTASRIPLLFFDITLGTAVASAFIPIFNEYLTKESKERAYAFTNIFITTVGLIAFFITLFLLLFPEAAVFIMAPGFDAQTAALSADLLRIMSPIVVIAVLCYSLVGFLQSMGEFRRPAMMSLLSNFAMMLYFLIGNRTFGIYGLGVALVIGWFLQLFILLRPLRDFSLKLHPVWQFKDAGLKSVLLLSVPVLISSWAQPINLLLSNTLASFVSGARSVSIVGYAYQLYFMIAGVFSLSMTNLFFPTMSRHFAAGERKEGANVLYKMLAAVTLIVFPVMVFLGIFSTDIIRIVYERGSFLPTDTLDTSKVLFAYTFGMLGVSWQEILNKYFYSEKNSKTPMFVAIGAIVINISVSAALIWHVQEVGIAVASTLSVLFAGVVLFILSRRENKENDISGVLQDVLKGLLAGICCALAMLGANFLLPVWGGICAQLMRLGICFAVGIMIYLGLLYVQKTQIFGELINSFRKR